MVTFVFPSTVAGSVLTPHLLKSRTGEFDLESISFLDLSGMGRYKKYIVAQSTGTCSGMWIEDPA